MQPTLRSVVAAGLIALSTQAGVVGQGIANTGPVPLLEAVALKELVDRVVGGSIGGGDAWLTWDNHFMRASDGRVYMPFTVTLNEAGTAFDSMAMYVRVVPRGGTGPANARVRGSELGTPVSVPERQFSRGNPTAGEASARLGLIESELSGVRAPFEGFFVARRPAETTAPLVQRSLVVLPGDYDLYLAVRERSPARGRGAPKTAVMQRTLTVPDLSGSDLAMSSVILAKRIDSLTRRLSPAQQAERPYALNSSEIHTAPGANFSAGDVFSAVFFLYNVAVDKGNLPDVTVTSRFRQMSAPGKIFGEMQPQRFGRDHTAPAFDLNAGHQLAVTQAVPLATFPPDSYELEIDVTDNLSGKSIRRAIRFTVRD